VTWTEPGLSEQAIEISSFFGFYGKENEILFKVREQILERRRARELFPPVFPKVPPGPGKKFYSNLIGLRHSSNGLGHNLIAVSEWPKRSRIPREPGLAEREYPSFGREA
jgi:hypothetical protein